MSKTFISPESLRLDSFMLGAKIARDGFKPDYIVAIWRGGAPIGCCVHEFLKRIGQKPDHIAIRTARYTGIDQASHVIEVCNLEYLQERLTKDSKVLLIDDVFDTGLTIQAIKQMLKELIGINCPTDIRTATIYYKPTRNKTAYIPEYYVKLTDKWLVFPHELEGLTTEEISQLIDPQVAQAIEELTNK